MQIYRDFIYTDLIPKQPKICKNLNSIICQMNGYLCLLIKTLLTLACLSWFFCFNYLFVYLFIYLFFLVLNIKLLNGFLRAVTRWNAWQHELQMQSFCFLLFFFEKKVPIQIKRDFIYIELKSKNTKICHNLNSIICHMDTYLGLLVKLYWLLLISVISFESLIYLFIYSFLFRTLNY